MGVKRSGKRVCLNLEIYGKFFIGFVLICTARISVGVTNPSDVTAINSLYISLGSPVLPGWVGTGGDPCGEGWQGIVCNISEIQSIVLNGANLRGELGDNLGMFASIISIDLSNNHIGGSIPSNLPVTMQNLFLADNNFTGSIPDSLSSLTLLKAMSLNDNFLSGEIPDAFQALPGLVNLDLSNNNLSGQLPSSFIDLASLTTLRLQDNQLSGTLDVLQDLPLRDLNVENNLFSGPIPDKLLAIPNFRNDGNPFNTSSAPLPAPTSSSPSPPTPTPPLSGAPPSQSSRRTPGKQADGPSSSEKSSSGGKNKRVVWISIAGVLLFVILALALVLLIPRCSRRRWEDSRIFKRHQVGENPRDNGSLVQATNQNEKVPKETAQKPKEDHPKPQNMHMRNEPKMNPAPNRDNLLMGIGRADIDFMAPPPPPPPPQPHGSGGAGSIRPGSMADRARMANIPLPETALKCPRCESTNTKFCYFNNYSLTQPRHFCKTCRRYWTRGGALRSVPVGGGCRRNKRSKESSSKSPISGYRQTGSCSSSTVSSNSGTSDTFGLGPQVPPMRFMAPLHHHTEFASGNIGLNYGALSKTLVGGASDLNFQMGSALASSGLGGNGGAGGSLLSMGGFDQWRMQQGQQLPFLGGLDSSASGLYPFEGGAEPSGYGGGADHIRPKISSSTATPLTSVKMEDNQELNMSRQFLGIPGNDQYPEWYFMDRSF